MTSLAPHGGDALGATPGHPLLTPALSGARDLSMSRQQALLDLAAIQRIPGIAGYWPADPAYLFEDSAGTVPASVGGVVGCWWSLGPAAIQATTAVKPYLRKTPRSGVYWLDSNTSTSALTATLGNLGTACTVARSGPDGPYFLENVTISSTYNIAPAYGFGGEVAIFNRALTASEKALITRYMRRYDTLYGSLVNASPQMRGVTANTEMVPNFGLITNFAYAWHFCSSLTTFPLLDTSSGTSFAFAWYSCSSLTSFPLLDTSSGTNFTNAWQGCSSLTSFPLLDTSAGTNFHAAWASCFSLTSFPLLDTSAGTNFYGAWQSCSSLTSFPLLDISAGTNFASAWAFCSSLTSFPLLDISAGTNFSGAWYICSSLTTFPANFFDAWGATPVADCFLNTWYNCTALTQTSLNNIVASLAVSGKAAPATGTAITLNGAPLLTTMQADSAFITAINTLKSRNWTPTYKGTAL